MTRRAAGQGDHEYRVLPTDLYYEPLLGHHSVWGPAVREAEREVAGRRPECRGSSNPDGTTNVHDVDELRLATTCVDRNADNNDMKLFEE